MNSLLAPLGVLGWTAREPVVIAALATEQPLLLVGPPGTAKTLLLERLAEALQLEFRHYNASILNFDDLAGFPVPDGDRVRYLRTPTDAWGAEAIFLDEINRCRLDMQNRLFPLVHERRLQGERLSRLRFRWAAMNPPPATDAYDPRGVEPLDSALADRFAFVVETPPLPEGRERIALIRGPARGAPGPLLDAVAATRGRLRLCEATDGDAVAAYVDAVCDALASAEILLSGRRLRFLYDNVLAVLATGLVEDRRDAALLALTWSLPDRALRPVPQGLVLTAHRASLAALADTGDPWRRRLLAERDPARRVALALAHPDDGLLAATVLDARAAMSPPERLALSSRLFPRLARGDRAVPALVFEALADDLGRLESLEEVVEELHAWDPRRKLADHVARAVAGLAPGERWIAAVLWTAYQERGLGDVAEAVAGARRVAQCVHGEEAA